MKFVILPDGRGETVIDPAAYLEQLPKLASALPVGARTFATDPGHYDFFSKRCVKDLKLAAIAIDNSTDETVIQISLRHKLLEA